MYHIQVETFQELRPGHYMKNLILGTAGHIDHGKTTLVKALTGVDTDRLPEEKARGITIELGFAPLDLGNGIRLGIVDVPGHERFIRTMVAGVGGMDIVMLVIAADEGIMPQTREHLDICALLGIKQGFVALTKSDLVDPEWIKLVSEEVEQFVSGTFLRGTPVIPVSSRSGSGLDLVREELRRLSGNTTLRKSSGPFRFPVDQVFSITGFGTVVTGTLLSGRIDVGDDAEILPSGNQTRIRGIQNHSITVEKGYPGQRLALNLQGLEHQKLKRGDSVTSRGAYRTTRVVDVNLQLLKTSPKPLKNRSDLRLHSATFEVAAQVLLLEGKPLEPGKSAFARLRLYHPVLLLHGDPFILRSSSPPETIAGGTILDPYPPARRRQPTEIMKLLEHLELGEEKESILDMITSSGFSGLPFEELANRSGLTSKRLEQLLSPMLAESEVIQAVREPAVYLSRDAFTRLCTLLTDELKAFMIANPLKEGIGREELKTRMPSRSDQRFFHACLSWLAKSDRLITDHEIVKLKGDAAGSSDQIEKNLLEIERYLINSGMEPVSVKQISERFIISSKSAGDHLNLLVRKGSAVKITPELYCHSGSLREIESCLTARLKETGEITPGAFRELTGLSRKFAIPQLEYFDAQKLTIRVGDKRILRKG